MLIQYYHSLVINYLFELNQLETKNQNNALSADFIMIFIRKEKLFDKKILVLKKLVFSFFTVFFWRSSCQFFEKLVEIRSGFVATLVCDFRHSHIGFY